MYVYIITWLHYGVVQYYHLDVYFRLVILLLGRLGQWEHLTAHF